MDWGHFRIAIVSKMGPSFDHEPRVYWRLNFKCRYYEIFFHSFKKKKKYFTVGALCSILYMYKLKGGPCDGPFCSPLPYRVVPLAILNIFDRPKWLHTVFTETERSEVEDFKRFSKNAVTGTTWTGKNGDNRGLFDGNKHHKISQNYQ